MLPVPVHVGTPAALSTLRLDLGPEGLMLGRDREGEPVALRLFGPAPVRLVLVAGEWAASLLAFRALAVGARVAVHTSAAPGHAWARLLPWVAATNNRLSIDGRSSATGFPHAPTRTDPLLEILDGRPDDRPDQAGWRVTLTLVRRAGDAAATVADADAALVQRLAPTEAAAIADVLRLSDATAELLTRLTDDMLAVVGGRADRYVWLGPTDTERHLFGEARRDDGPLGDTGSTR
jgi:hypothetical protein